LYHIPRDYGCLGSEIILNKCAQGLSYRTFQMNLDFMHMCTEFFRHHKHVSVLALQ